MRTEYPTRCQIIDIAGQEIMPGIIANTPEVSKPYIGKLGWATLCDDGLNVKISLDDGSILMGYQCWWKSIGSA